MRRQIWTTIAILCLPGVAGAQVSGRPSNVLPAEAASALAASLDAAKRHPRHVWRDTPPLTGEGAVNAYVEIPRGERRKWEFEMRANARTVDRVMPAELGGYPVNYGFVPQTVFYDGDPFDVLVLGPPLPGGRLVRGVIVGVLLMEDENGTDSKVVVSPADAEGNPSHVLDAAERERIARFFRRYKRHEPDGFSKVSGWGSPDDGRAHVHTAHAFFLRCRDRRGGPCRIQP